MSNADIDTIEQLNTIAERLASTKLGDFHPFGAESHCFDFVGRKTEPELHEFETQHHITLPAEYRLFLQHVGDGGAGPAYGILTLQEACDHDSNSESDGVLARPFPHTESYRPEDDPAFRELYDAEYTGPQTLSAEDRRDHYRLLAAGTVPLCHEGCGYYHRLVITGPTRGEMWLDGRVSDGGFYWGLLPFQCLIPRMVQTLVR